MVKVDVGDKSKGQTLSCYYDGYLKAAYDSYKKYVLEHNQDNIGLFVGREGRGKTTMMNQYLKYMDPTYDETRCFTTSEQLINALRNAKPFQAFGYDEAQEFTSRSALSKLNRNLVYALSMVRAKKLFIGMSIPNFFELDRYPAMHRAEFMVEVRTLEGKWGFFSFWNWPRKKELYMQGKKNYSYDVVKPNFTGRFTNVFIINEEIYNKQKMDSINKALEKNMIVKNTAMDVALRKYNRFKTIAIAEKELLFNNGFTYDDILEKLESLGIKMTRNHLAVLFSETSIDEITKEIDLNKEEDINNNADGDKING